MISGTLNNILMAIFVILTIWCLSLIPYSIGRSWGYQAGQIDALNGKIHYRLEKQENSEFKWVECPDVCDYGKEEE